MDTLNIEPIRNLLIQKMHELWAETTITNWLSEHGNKLNDICYNNTNLPPDARSDKIVRSALLLFANTGLLP